MDNELDIFFIPWEFKWLIRIHICRLLTNVVTLDFWYLFLMLVWLTFNIGLSWHPRVVFTKAFLFPSPTLIRSGGEGEWPFSGARRFLADQSEWFINHIWTILFGFRGRGSRGNKPELPIKLYLMTIIWLRPHNAQQGPYKSILSELEQYLHSTSRPYQV